MKSLTKAQIKRFLTEPEGNIELSSKKTMKYYEPSNIALFFQDLKEHRKTLLAIVKKYPLFTISRLLDTSPNKNSLQSLFILDIIASNPQWQAPLKEHCSDEQIRVLERLMTFAKEIDDADIKDLPVCLTEPVWEKEYTPLPEIEIEPIDVEPCYQWHKGTNSMSHVFLTKPELHILVSQYNQSTQKSETVKEFKVANEFNKCAQSTTYDDINPSCIESWNIEQKALWILGIKAEYVTSVLSTQKVEEGFFEEREYILWRDCAFYHLPKELVLKVIENAPYNNFPEVSVNNIAKLLYWLGDDFLTVIYWLLPVRFTQETYALLNMVGWHGFASEIANNLNNRWLKDSAQQWLTTYTEHAVHGLLPDAFRPLSSHSAWLSISLASDQKDARRALVFLAENQNTKTLFYEALSKYGDDVQKAVELLLINKNADEVPYELPVLPKNLYIPSLPQLVLKKNGLAVPSEYIDTVLQILSLCPLDEESNTLSQLKENITKQSLASFCRELFNWYDSQDRPSKYRWMFNIQGHVGDDETARFLTQICKRFRAMNNRIGACDALDMLTYIGSDTALMYINEFATQKRYKGLKERAEKALKEIATSRGMSMVELADRTVPDLGLDHTGKLMLDFGARQFIVSFNELLQPQIFEADDKHNLGKLRKTLPKPAKKDDATLASSATQQFKDLKKQLKSIASMQVKRLEQAMCDERTWNFDDFQRFFVNHPLMRHLSQRLAWSMYELTEQGKSFVGLCRVTEELTFTDENDDDLLINDIKDYRFSIAHAINIPEEKNKKFSSLLQDYEILQPFEQLSRITYIIQKKMSQCRNLMRFYRFGRIKKLLMLALWDYKNDNGHKMWIMMAWLLVLKKTFSQTVKKMPLYL